MEIDEWPPAVTEASLIERLLEALLRSIPKSWAYSSFSESDPNQRHKQTAVRFWCGVFGGQDAGGAVGSARRP